MPQTSWFGSAATDRNLYVQSIDVNGVHFAGRTASNTAANRAEATGKVGHDRFPNGPSWAGRRVGGHGA
jgi:hypothetical protein